MRMQLWRMPGGSAIFIWAATPQSSSSSMVWRLAPPTGDPRPSVVLGLARRSRTRPTFEDEDDDEDQNERELLTALLSRDPVGPRRKGAGRSRHRQSRIRMGDREPN